jgi:diguanylate cyclase (GGDEF)-like protein
MLKNCTRLIRTSLRKADTFARTGGDEFYIILPKTPMEYAESMAKRIISRIEDFNACSDLPPLSISIGIAAKDCPMFHWN